MSNKFVGCLVILGLLVSGSCVAFNHVYNGDKPAATTAYVDLELDGEADSLVPDNGGSENTEQNPAADTITGSPPPADISAPANKETSKPVSIKPDTTTPETTSKPSYSSNTISRGTDTSKYPLVSKMNGSYGQFHYRNLSGGRIEVDPQWISANIVTITLPGLNRKVQVHREAADNFIKAFTYIKNGTATVNGKQVSLLSLVKTMDGTWVTRHVNWDPSRGLSNHSWGTAIDINAADHFRYVDPSWERNDPNLILWEKAFKPAGFSWGNSYSDSMHYELLD